MANHNENPVVMTFTYYLRFDVLISTNFYYELRGFLWDVNDDDDDNNKNKISRVWGPVPGPTKLHLTNAVSRRPHCP